MIRKVPRQIPGLTHFPDPEKSTHFACILRYFSDDASFGQHYQRRRKNAFEKVVNVLEILMLRAALYRRKVQLRIRLQQRER